MERGNGGVSGVVAVCSHCCVWQGKVVGLFGGALTLTRPPNKGENDGFNFLGQSLLQHQADMQADGN